MTGWSPFVPNEADDSSLPVAALEYRFTNPSDAPAECAAGERVRALKLNKYDEKVGRRLITEITNRLQYLMDVYRIPLPVRLPYGTTPRVDELIPPVLENDAEPEGQVFQ